MVKPISKINGWMQRTIPQIYTDSMSYYELLELVWAKLDEVIEASNEYFAQDIKDYTAQILQEWFDNGKLAEIINEDIFEMKADRNDLYYINVKQPPYNLKGDGSDESAAIQILLDLAKTEGSVRLYFPDGEYGMSGYLRLYSNTTVLMASNASIKHLGSGYKVFVNGELGNPIYSSYYEGEGNIHFIGGTIDLNTNGSTVPYDRNMSAFDLGHGENISFVGLTVKNGQNGHYFQVSSCKNIRFRDCVFKDQKHTNQTSYNYEVIQIEMATAASFPTFGNYDLSVSREITIEGCTFENVIRGVGTHTDGYYGTSTLHFCENIKISDCVFNGVADDAVKLMGYRNVNLVNNEFKNIAGQAIYMYTVEDSQILHNLVNGCQKAGLYMRYAHNNVFDSNILKEVGLSPTSYAAFRIATCNDNRFINNTVSSKVPTYTYAMFLSDGCTGNLVQSHNYKKGTSGLMGGSGEDFTNLQYGTGYKVLWEGEIGTDGATANLSEDIRCFSHIIVVGNDNSSTTAMLTSVTIHQSIFYAGSAVGRFRMLPDIWNGERLDFSFPTWSSIRTDETNGVGRIRKVIGVL
jgi:hypothetical protein